MPNKIHIGNNIDVLKSFPDNSVDSVITDPPYGLVSITKRFGKEDSVPAKYGSDGAFARVSKGFMGQEWDGSGIEYNVELWSECLRVAKPGSILMAFGGTRTWYRIATAIEDAGWEIIDSIAWIYGSGFPKSYDISKGINKKLGIERSVVGTKVIDIGMQSGNMHAGRDSNFVEVVNDVATSNEAVVWDGWKTALKPSFEPIIVAKKPLDGTNVDNALRWGVCGFNIEGGRIPAEHSKANDLGRYPANTILGCYCESDTHDDDCPVRIMDEQSGYKKGSGISYDYTGEKEYDVDGFIKNIKPNSPSNRGDSGGASRFFYCGKASKSERNAGLHNLKPKQKIFNGKSADSSKEMKDVEERFTTKPQANFHPTVKPLKLMEYLCVLTKTPTGGVVLDPFCGSGTTLLAARNTGREYIGIELNPEYAAIAQARLDGTKGLF